jgi:hypothetical protein
MNIPEGNYGNKPKVLLQNHGEAGRAWILKNGVWFSTVNLDNIKVEVKIMIMIIVIIINLITTVIMSDE